MSENNNNFNRKANGVIKATFPVALLSENRECLVIGGGKIANHKAHLLLAANAKVTIVSPMLSKQLQELVKLKNIIWIDRKFQEEDLDGKSIVFAATDDGKVNQTVLKLCELRKTLACAVDRHWSEGDFVTPATIRQDGITISISTGGKSCRRARLIKENLNRHLTTIKNTELLILGTSHNFLSVSEREPLHLVADKLNTIANMLAHVWGVHEFMLLNTCNRVELIATASRDVIENGILERLMNFSNISENHYYLKRGYAAFQHTAMLNSGLLSQIPGEKHIVSQVKEAFNMAREKNWAGTMIEEWISTSLHISKHIRQMFAPILEHLEIEDLCLKYLDKTNNDKIKPKKVMVIGTGVIGQGVIKKYLKDDAHCIWCYHRNKPQLSIKEKEQITLCTFNELRDKLVEVDIIVCATGGDNFILTQAHAPFMNQEDDLLVIDLGMPRNVDPTLKKLVRDIELVDLDDLKHWYRRKMVDLQYIHEESQKIIREHQGNYDKIIQSFQGR